jgi:hypothetical protein
VSLIEEGLSEWIEFLFVLESSFESSDGVPANAKIKNAHIRKSGLYLGSFNFNKHLTLCRLLLKA